MTLDEYLSQTGQTQRAFGERVGVMQTSIARYVKGRRIPRPEIMQRITVATDGRVSASDFYPPVLNAEHQEPPFSVSQSDAENSTCPTQERSLATEKRMRAPA